MYDNVVDFDEFIDCFFIVDDCVGVFFDLKVEWNDVCFGLIRKLVVWVLVVVGEC